MNDFVHTVSKATEAAVSALEWDLPLGDMPIIWRRFWTTW